MITENKYLKLAFKLLSVICVVAIGTCFIVDFSISKSITWAAFPIAAIPFSWAVISPILLCAKNKTLYSLGMFSIVLLPLLFILERLTIAHGWFAALGMPIGVTVILTTWIIYAIIKFVKLNYWYLSAIFVFLCGIIVSSVVRYFVSSFLDVPFINLESVINTVSCIVVVILLVFIGQGKHRKE